MGLWNGLPVRIVMIGTLTGLQWMIYVSIWFLCQTLLIDNVAGLLQDLHGPPDHWRSSPTTTKELDIRSADSFVRHG